MAMRLFAEVPDGAAIKLRDVTPEEEADAKERQAKLATLDNQIEALKAEMKTLVDACPHTVLFDTPGFPYDIRECLGCGKNMGLV